MTNIFDSHGEAPHPLQQQLIFDTSQAKQELKEFAEVAVKSLREAETEAQKLAAQMEAMVKARLKFKDDPNRQRTQVVTPEGDVKLFTKAKLDQQIKALNEQYQKALKLAQDLAREEHDVEKAIQGARKANQLFAQDLEKNPQHIAKVKNAYADLERQIDRISKVQLKSPAQQKYLDDLKGAYKLNGDQIEHLIDLEHKHAKAIQDAISAEKKRAEEARIAYESERKAAEQAEKNARTLRAIQANPQIRPDKAFSSQAERDIRESGLRAAFNSKAFEQQQIRLNVESNLAANRKAIEASRYNLNELEKQVNANIKLRQKQADEIAKIAKKQADAEAKAAKKAADAAANVIKNRPAKLDKEILSLTTQYLRAQKAAEALGKANKGIGSKEILEANKAVEIHRQKLHAALVEAKALGSQTANMARAQAVLAGAFEKTQKPLSGLITLAGNLGSALTGSILAIDHVINGIGAAFNLVKKTFIDTNVQLEQAELAIAGVFNNAYVEEFSTSLQRSKKFVEGLREEAVKTNLTFQELFQSATTALPQLINRGASEQQALTIISKLAQAGKFALADRFEPSRLNDEIRALVNKKVSGRTNETLQFLGITNADLKPLKTMADLVDLVNKKTRGLEATNKEFQKTFLGGVDRMQDEFFRLATQIGKPLFREVTVSLIRFNDELKNGNLDGIIRQVEFLAGILSKLVVSLGDAAAAFERFINSPTGKALDKFANPLRTINTLLDQGLAKHNPKEAIANAVDINDLQKHSMRVSVNRNAAQGLLDQTEKELKNALALRDGGFGHIPLFKEWQENNIKELKKNIEDYKRRISEADEALDTSNIFNKVEEFALNGKTKPLPPGVLRDTSSLGLGGEEKRRKKRTRLESSGLADGLNQEKTEIEKFIDEYSRKLEDLNAKAETAKGISRIFAVDGLGEISIESQRLKDVTELNAQAIDTLTKKLAVLEPQLKKAKEEYIRLHNAADQARSAVNDARDAQLDSEDDGTGITRRIAPVDGKITGAFNESRPGHKHGGIDIAAALGTPVVAPLSGQVTEVQTAVTDGRGKYVVVKTDDGLLNRFFHLSEASVKVGDSVIQGQEIGKVGSTGHSTGPHLHFEVAGKQGNIDPRAVLGASSKNADVISEAEDNSRIADRAAQEAEKKFNQLQADAEKGKQVLAEAQKLRQQVVFETVQQEVDKVVKPEERTQKLTELLQQIDALKNDLNFSEGERLFQGFAENTERAENAVRVLNARIEKFKALLTAGGVTDAQGKFIAFTEEEKTNLQNGIEDAQLGVALNRANLSTTQTNQLGSITQLAISKAQEKIQSIELKRGEITQAQIDAFKLAINTTLLQDLGRISSARIGQEITINGPDGKQEIATISDKSIQEAKRAAEGIEAANKEIARSYTVDVVGAGKQAFDNLFDSILNGTANFKDAFLGFFKDIATQMERIFSSKIADQLNQFLFGGTGGFSFLAPKAGSPTAVGTPQSSLAQTLPFLSLITGKAAGSFTPGKGVLQSAQQDLAESKALKVTATKADSSTTGATLGAKARGILIPVAGAIGSFQVGRMAGQKFGKGKGALAGLGAGTIIGGLAGSVLGPVGTILGASIGGTLGGIGGLFGGKSSSARQAKRAEYQDNVLSPALDKIINDADPNSLASLQAAVLKAGRGVKGNGERGMEMKKAAVTKLKEMIADLQKRVTEALDAINEQIEEFSRPFSQRGIVPDIKKTLADFKEHLKMGVSPNKIFEAFNLYVRDSAATLQQQLDDTVKAINQGAEDDQGNLISLAKGLSNQIEKIQKDAQESLENIRTSFASQASAIIGEGRASAITPSAATRQQRLALLGQKQRKEETDLQTNTTNAILRATNETNREIADLQKQANATLDKISLLLNTAISQGSAMLPGFDTSFIQAMQSFLGTFNPFQSISLAPALEGGVGINIDKLVLPEGLDATAIGQAILDAINQAEQNKQYDRTAQQV